MQQHLFVMDPIPNLNLDLDSSIRIAFCLRRMGCECFFAEGSDLFWSGRSKRPAVFARHMCFPSDDPQTVVFSDERREIFLDAFQCILMRKDPPYDMDYLSTTWLLQEASKKTLVINHPRVLQSLNEKMAILNFPEFTAPSLVSTNVEQILEFICKDCAGNAVLKPLELFGGRGIERISIGSEKFKTKEDIRAFLRSQTNEGKTYRIVQPFNVGIYEGEVRVFTLAGEPIAWALKVPSPGSFLANTAAGARVENYEPSLQEVEMVRHVGSVLYKQSAVLVGFDLIGGKISEINVTSPRLLQNKPSLVPYEKVAQYIFDRSV